jgi:hypothetical protein
MANRLYIATDYSMNGCTADLAAKNIQDKTIVNQFKRISELSAGNEAKTFIVDLECGKFFYTAYWYHLLLICSIFFI